MSDPELGDRVGLLTFVVALKIFRWQSLAGEEAKVKKLIPLIVVLTGCFEAVEQAPLNGSPAAGGSVAIVDPSDGVCVAIGISGTNVQPNNSPNGCLCTRRDEQPRGDCTRGGGESASAMIGPAGGTVTLVGQAGKGVPFTLEIPPDALVTPTVIKVTETTLPPPAVDWSPVYRIEPVSLVLARPAKVKVPWSQGPIWGAPTLYWSETSLCTLTALPSSSSNAGFNQGEIRRLGYAMSAYASQGSAPMCR